MSSRLRIEKLREEQIPELASAIRHPAVYEHIGGEVPSFDEFSHGLKRALAGPPTSRRHELWLNFLVRHAETNQVLGQLQSTIINGVAEVAFLFDPAVWGRGYASEGLMWLHTEVARAAGDVQFWATTVPTNLRCQSVLRRCGYIEVPYESAPPLACYEPGDLVFRREAGMKDG